MISRKDWNNLSPSTRQRAAQLVFHNAGEDFQREMSEEWHHNNDNWHELLFKSLYWVVPNKELKVVISFNV